MAASNNYIHGPAAPQGRVLSVRPFLVATLSLHPSADMRVHNRARAPASALRWLSGSWLTARFSSALVEVRRGAPAIYLKLYRNA
jgi:hypothetical protein